MRTYACTFLLSFFHVRMFILPSSAAFDSESDSESGSEAGATCRARSIARIKHVYTYMCTRYACCDLGNETCASAQRCRCQRPLPVQTTHTRTHTNVTQANVMRHSLARCASPSNQKGTRMDRIYAAQLYFERSLTAVVSKCAAWWTGLSTFEQALNKRSARHIILRSPVVPCKLLSRFQARRHCRGFASQKVSPSFQGMLHRL